MGAMQRRKGATAEREIVAILRGRGMKAQRTAPLQTAAVAGLLPGGISSADVTCDGLPGVHLEVKRAETIKIEAWCRQAEGDAKEGGSVPVVVWRRSGQPWRVTLPLEDFLDMHERKANA